jgi:transposase-like protein
MKRTRRNHGATFKAQVALAAVKGDKTLAELSEQFHVHPTQVTEWKQQLLARAADVFGGTKPTSDTPDLKTLHAKIGQLALENDFLEHALIKAGLLSAKR